MPSPLLPHAVACCCTYKTQLMQPAPMLSFVLLHMSDTQGHYRNVERQQSIQGLLTTSASPSTAFALQPSASTCTHCFHLPFTNLNYPANNLGPACSRSWRDVSGAVSGGKGVVYNSSCFSNLFVSDTNTTTTAVDKPGLVCPALHIQRPSNQSNLTTAFFYNYVEADPLLYSFANCSCADPLEPHYHRDTAGLPSYNPLLTPTQTAGKCVRAFNAL